MKTYSYMVKGCVAEERIPDLCQRLEALPEVQSAELSNQGQTDGFILKLTPDAPLTEEARIQIETAAADLLAELGLTLLLPALADTYVTTPPPKEGKKISLSAAIGSVITCVILAVLLTFSLTTMYGKRNADVTVQAGQGETETDQFAVLNLLDKLFDDLSPLELKDDEEFLQAVLKSYVAATGDPYAEYFTDEEYAEMISEQNGDMCGIGVSVVNDLLTVEGVSYQAIIVTNVYPDSPAEEAGVLPGDAIMFVGVDETRVMVHTVGYTEALNLLKGEEGTLAEFTVYRRPAGSDEGTPYETVEFSVAREKLTTRSVTYHVCDTDDKVGIVRVTGFDNTTASQFSVAVDALKAEGCEHFVIDMRNNPGGLLTSVEDVLTYFLQEGDVILSTKDKQGREEYLKVLGADSNGKLMSGSGTLTVADIGKYRDLSVVVLTNEYTASAAELFTANIRDYELGKVVGVTTYGKGSMQTTFSLASYGYEGALKLTTRFYYPPCGEGYDGVGIVPDKEVALSEEALKYNINLLPDALDNQLQEAIAILYE